MSSLGRDFDDEVRVDEIKIQRTRRLGEDPVVELVSGLLSLGATIAMKTIFHLEDFAIFNAGVKTLITLGFGIAAFFIIRSCIPHRT